ncbi:MAG: TolC family protein, partial [Gemmatimonadota bacterium]
SAQQVVTSTRLSYYGVLLAQEQLRLTSNSLDRVEQVLDETRKLNRAGLASAYDVLRLEVELTNLEPNVRRSRDALASARRSLAVEMGVESLDGVELAGSLLELELPDLPGGRPVANGAAGYDVGARSDARGLLLSAGVPAEALPAEELLELARARRSDLLQLRLTRELRETERKAEWSNYLPTVSVFGTWTKQSQHDGGFEFFGGNSFETGAVGIQVDIPLFSGFQRPARVSRMSAVVDQVDAQLGYAEEQAENEVATLRDQAREAHQRVAAQRRAVDQATRGYEIARREYRAGVGSQLQVTDAELALRQSEFNYAQSVYDYLTAQARLDAAIGVVPMVDTGAVALQG